MVLVVYFLSPLWAKNGVLLLSSLLFYGWGEPKAVIWMLLAIALGYVSGVGIQQNRERPIARRAFLLLGVVGSLSLLGYFKYADFLLENLNALTGLSLPLPRVTLPIGISFYTFQLLSYCVDVYRGDVPAQTNPIDLATYVALFPQLIAGPIVRYQDVALQLRTREHTMDKAARGIRRFCAGLGKKILLANTLGTLCQLFRQSGDRAVLYYWLYAIAFCLQLYFDFSGYSDMAIGLGQIFGFDFPENFRYPYTSGSITQFWRRWHISLGSWFRDYVYIPLGGNRVSPLRQLLNIGLVWMLTGLWHGAAWNFVVWGVYFALLLTGEKRLWGRYLDKSRVGRHLYVLIAVCVSFVIFDAQSLSQTGEALGAMFGLGDLPLASAEFWYQLRSYGAVLLLGALGATSLPARLSRKLQRSDLGRAVVTFAEPVALCALLVLCTAYLVDGSYNPFLYFRF